MPGSARTGVSFARLSFLLLVLLGTAGMHTMGHPPEPSPAAATAMPAMPSMPDHDDDRHGPDPASVCVAVLLGGLAFGLPALAHRRRSRPAGRPARLRVDPWARPSSLLPPPRPPDPNRSAVLRT